MVQSACPSLVHSSGVRTSITMDFNDLVVSLIGVEDTGIAAVAAKGLSVLVAFMAGELQATA